MKRREEGQGKKKKEKKRHRFESFVVRWVKKKRVEMGVVPQY